MSYSFTQWAAVRILVGEMIDPPQNTPVDPAFLRPTWIMSQQQQQFNHRIIIPLQLKCSKTYDKRPRIRGGFRSTDNPDIWEGRTFRWWSRSDTTGNFLLLRIRWSCCNVFNIREAAGRLVEMRIRPERKVGVWLGREANVRIDCVHRWDRCKIAGIANCIVAGSHTVNCT